MVCEEYIYIIVKNLDYGVRGIVQKAALGSGGGIIFKIVNFVIILISIQNNFLINSVTASLAEVCYFKPDQFKLSTSFPEIWQARIFGSTI